jgi:hypothetical protein
VQATSTVYFVLGDLGEALILVGSAVTTVGIAVIQEHRTERVLEALRDLTSPRALVVRDTASSGGLRTNLTREYRSNTRLVKLAQVVLPWCNGRHLCSVH